MWKERPFWPRADFAFDNVSKMELQEGYMGRSFGVGGAVSNRLFDGDVDPGLFQAVGRFDVYA